MSDFRNPEEATVSREDKELLPEGSWRHRHAPPTEPRESISRQSTFGGASSMMELSERLTLAEGNFTASSEQNLHRVLREVERLRTTSQRSGEPEYKPEPPYVARFLERAHALYESQDPKGCLEILQEGLKLAPGHPEILALTQKARQASERRQAELEASHLTHRIAQFKAEAIKLFEQGQYSDCVKRFGLLSELEPADRDLRDYLEISLEQVEKQKKPQLDSASAVHLKNQDTAVPSTPAPEVPEPAVVSPSEPPAPVIVIEAQGADQPEVSIAQPSLPSPQTQEDSSAEVIPELASELSPKMLEHPATAQVNEMGSQGLTPGSKEAELKAATDLTSGPSEDQVQRRAKKVKIAFLGGGLVIGAVLGAWLALNRPEPPNGPEAQLQPDNSEVRLDPAPPLPTDSAVSSKGDLQTLAQKTFQQGRLLEANLACEIILEKEPDNSFALNLKEQIRQRFANLGSQAAANRRWDEASVAWSNVLKVFPNDHEAVGQLKAVRVNLKKQDQMTPAGKQESEKRIQELHQQISLAVSSGRYLPPSSGNALELIQQLEGLAPHDAFGKEKLDQVFRELMAQTKRALQSKDSTHASALVRQMQKHFPETSELKALRENIKAEEVRRTEARNLWMQKAEVAMAAGRYVTPGNDNAIAYCNQLLAVEPQNLKALGLKKESSTKANAQAKAWIQEGKYDDARAVYSSLLNLPQNESQFSPNSQQLKAEVDRLTFSAYPVVHDHTFGSCTGRLRFNGYQITFVPSTESKDGFAVKLSEIVQVESGDKLKIHFKGKAYRFRANATRNPLESQAKISEIHQKLSALISGGK